MKARKATPDTWEGFGTFKVTVNNEVGSRQMTFNEIIKFDFLTLMEERDLFALFEAVVRRDQNFVHELQDKLEKI